MPKARVTVSVDSDLLEQARQRSVDLDRAAEVGLRGALDRQVDDRLQDWVDRHRENLARKAERDRTQGLANERLRAF
jgi:post-segregation antitoxin (ccd killing protein)